MSHRDAYRVIIRHNLVVAVEVVSVEQEQFSSPTNLEIGTQLARNHLARGCIDGDYVLGSVDDAKDFAVLSLDFVRLLFEKSLKDLKSHNFYQTSSWRNPSAAPLPRD